MEATAANVTTANSLRGETRLGFLVRAFGWEPVSLIALPFYCVVVALPNTATFLLRTLGAPLEKN